MKKYDLHVHTSASDGALTPSQVVERASSLGLAGIAVTDHDTVAGLAEALSAGEHAGVDVITGVEFSVESENEMHILGYCIGHARKLEHVFLNLNNARRERNPMIVDKLKSLGMDISIEEVEKEAGESVVGRPHIARVLMKKGYVSSIKDAFERYLAVGRPGFAYRKKLLPHRAIALIREEGGLPVLAHPKLLHLPPEQLEQLAAGLAQSGLWGIEAYYPSHTPDETRLFCGIARRAGLYVTSGSDFHDSIRNELDMGCAWSEDEMLAQSLDILITTNQKALSAG